MSKSEMKEAFTATKGSLDAKSEKLIEALRTTVLHANSHGEFLELGISPDVVLNDDFVLRAKTFVELQSKQNSKVIVGYWMKKTAPFPEGLLLAVLSGGRAIETHPGTLTIVRFSGKNADNDFFQTLLDVVVSVLQDFFPVLRREDSGTANNKENTCRSGMELKEALLNAKYLRESSHSKPRVYKTIEEVDESAPSDENKTVELTVTVAEVALVLILILWTRR